MPWYRKDAQDTRSHEKPDISLAAEQQRYGKMLWVKAEPMNIRGLTREMR